MLSAEPGTLCCGRSNVAIVRSMSGQSLKNPGYPAELKEVLRNARYYSRSFHHSEDANSASGDCVGIRIRHHAIIC